MSEVVRIHGGEPICHPGKPDRDVIEAVERLLEMARSGEINGLAYVVHYFDDASGDRFVGALSSKTVGRLFSVMNRISQQIDNT